MQIGQIVAGCAAPHAALGVDSSGNLTMLAATYPADPNTIWVLDQGFTPGLAPLGATIRHQATGKYLSARSDGSLVFGPLSEFDGWSTWTFGGQYSSRYAAVRPLNDEDLNLNVLGGCGNTSVGLWSWGGGDSNEIWEFVRTTTAPPPSRYVIRSGCADSKGNHCALAVGSSSPVACGSWDPAVTIWHVEVAVSQNGWLMGGIAIINEQNGQALRSMGANTRVGFGSATSLDGQSVWTIGGGDGSNTYVALRPLSDDDQNLNVEGGCGGGTPAICTWGWGGGDPNEIWTFTPFGFGTPVLGGTRSEEPTKAETW